MNKQPNTNHSLIEIPVRFRIACTLYKLTEQQVLQIFIDHCTLYDFFSGLYSEGYTEVAGTIEDSLKNSRLKNVPKAFRHCRDSPA